MSNYAQPCPYSGDYPTEHWRPVVGYGKPESRYEVSNLGHVRRAINPFKGIKGKYLQVGFEDRHKKMLHHLVMEAFVGPRPEGLVTNHKDGNGLNPCVTNLEYTTQAENHRHAVRTGLHTYGSGENATRSHITDDQRREIIRRKLLGEPLRKIAKSMEITLGCVVHTNVCWNKRLGIFKERSQ